MRRLMEWHDQHWLTCTWRRRLWQIHWIWLEFPQRPSPVNHRKPQISKQTADDLLRRDALRSLLQPFWWVAAQLRRRPRPVGRRLGKADYRTEVAKRATLRLTLNAERLQFSSRQV